MHHILLFCAVAQPAAATTLTCAFETECIDADGCNATDYEAQYDYEFKQISPDGSVSRATRDDINGTTSGLMAERDAYLRFVAGAFYEGMEETLTVTPDGDARLMVLLPEVPMQLTYVGTCEVDE